MKRITIAIAVSLLAAPVFAGGHASGDAAAGEKVFSQCQSCHVVKDADGNTLAGRNAKTGPNLWSLPGRTIGSEEGFRYGKSIVAVGEAGGVWDEANFVEYVQDPKAYLARVLDDSKARSKMAFKVRKEEDAVNLWAFIASLSPEPES